MLRGRAGGHRSLQRSGVDIQPCVKLSRKREGSKHVLTLVINLKFGLNKFHWTWWGFDTGRQLPSWYIFSCPTNSLWSLKSTFNPLNAELSRICYLLALLAHHFLHVSRIRVKSLTLSLLMSYTYIHRAPILDVSRSHTTTQHSR